MNSNPHNNNVEVNFSNTNFVQGTLINNNNNVLNKNEQRNFEKFNSNFDYVNINKINNNNHTNKNSHMINNQNHINNSTAFKDIKYVDETNS